jgi:2,4-dienoyl-CoA reductase (NADPH2)
VPRGAFAWVTRRLKGEVAVPLITTNRINMPDVAEKILAGGDADMVSMARPLLADSDWVKKAQAGRSERINTCIACNQACLDHVFENQHATCLLNRAHATKPNSSSPAPARKALPWWRRSAGLALRHNAGRARARGHVVRCRRGNRRPVQHGQAHSGQGGIPRVAALFRYRIEDTGVTLRLNTRATAQSLRGFDSIVLATGVTPRALKIPGAEHPKAMSYLDVVLHGKPVGARVAIIGAGGIGFDVAEFLTQAEPSPSTDVARWSHEWGVDQNYANRGGLAKPAPEAPEREVWLLQRTPGTPGKRLNKTTGWVHRAALKMKNVKMLGGVNYERIDDAGLHVTIDGAAQVIDVDNVVICAGQEPRRDLYDGLKAANVDVHLIGGADVAAELDAKRAIAQGTRLAMSL